MNIVLFGHGGYCNRGCEAIIRATVGMLKNEIPDCKIGVCSYELDYDVKRNYGLVDKLYPHHNVRYTIPHLSAYGFRKLGMKKLDTKLQYHWLKAPLKWGDVFISIGGDNYCYEEPVDFFHIDKTIKEHGKKLIMWGASFDKDLMTPNMREDLARFDKIYVRETLSFDALEHHGIENVELMHDSAFVMDVKDVDDDGKKYIGFNLSPLSLNYSSDKGAVKTATYNMMDYIIENTGYDIKLIPHVLDETRPETQFDPGVLQPLYEKYKDTGRVHYVDTTKLSAEEVKGEIKSCMAFIGARTHATIAAYSTLVPTTVIGYSVKSRGIAKDLFGTNDEYVIPVGDIKEDTLVDAVKRLIDKNDELRDYLTKKMPEYKDVAYGAGKSLKDVING